MPIFFQLGPEMLSVKEALLKMWMNYFYRETKHFQIGIVVHVSGQEVCENLCTLCLVFAVNQK